MDADVCWFTSDDVLHQLTLLGYTDVSDDVLDDFTAELKRLAMQDSVTTSKVSSSSKPFKESHRIVDATSSEIQELQQHPIPLKQQQHDHLKCKEYITVDGGNRDSLHYDASTLQSIYVSKSTVSPTTSEFTRSSNMLKIASKPHQANLAKEDYLRLKRRFHHDNDVRNNLSNDDWTQTSHHREHSTTSPIEKPHVKMTSMSKEKKNSKPHQANMAKEDYLRLKRRFHYDDDVRKDLSNDEWAQTIQHHEHSKTSSPEKPHFNMTSMPIEKNENSIENIVESLSVENEERVPDSDFAESVNDILKYSRSLVRAVNDTLGIKTDDYPDLRSLYVDGNNEDNIRAYSSENEDENQEIDHDVPIQRTSGGEAWSLDPTRYSSSRSDIHRIKSFIRTVPLHEKIRRHKTDPLTRYQEHQRHWQINSFLQGYATREKTNVYGRGLRYVPAVAENERQRKLECRKLQNGGSNRSQRQSKTRSNYVIPGERAHYDVRREVRDKLERERDVSKSSQRTIPQPSGYIPPPDRRRDSLRWAVRERVMTS